MGAMEQPVYLRTNGQRLSGRFLSFCANVLIFLSALVMIVSTATVCVAEYLSQFLIGAAWLSASIVTFIAFRLMRLLGGSLSGATFTDASGPGLILFLQDLLCQSFYIQLPVVYFAAVLRLDWLGGLYLVLGAIGFALTLKWQGVLREKREELILPREAIRKRTL